MNLNEDINSIRANILDVLTQPPKSCWVQLSEMQTRQKFHKNMIRRKCHNPPEEGRKCHFASFVMAEINAQQTANKKKSKLKKGNKKFFEPLHSVFLKSGPFAFVFEQRVAQRRSSKCQLPFVLQDFFVISSFCQILVNMILMDRCNEARYGQ